jgi:hypothetical protein
MTKIDFNKELTNFEIIDICEKLGIKLIGVYMRDELQPNLKNGSYVINLDGHEGNGSHWTAFIKNGKMIYYMDSFGMPPPQDEVDIFKDEHDELIFNRKELQNINSVICGYYCIAYMNYMKGKGNMQQKFDKYIRVFTKDTKANDEKIKQYFLSLDNINKLY